MGHVGTAALRTGNVMQPAHLCQFILTRRLERPFEKILALNTKRLI